VAARLLSSPPASVAIARAAADAEWFLLGRLRSGSSVLGVVALGVVALGVVALGFRSSPPLVRPPLPPRPSWRPLGAPPRVLSALATRNFAQRLDKDYPPLSSVWTNRPSGPSPLHSPCRRQGPLALPRSPRCLAPLVGVGSRPCLRCTPAVRWIRSGRLIAHGQAGLAQPEAGCVLKSAAVDRHSTHRQASTALNAVTNAPPASV
jgi:hypothetical protein